MVIFTSLRLFAYFITQTTAFTLSIIGFSMSSIPPAATLLAASGLRLSTIAIRLPAIIRLTSPYMGCEGLSRCWMDAGACPEMP